MNPNTTTIIGSQKVNVLNEPHEVTTIPNISVSMVETEIEGLKINHGDLYVGIDPGSVNMGMAVLGDRGATLYQIKMPSGESDAIKRIELTGSVVRELLLPYIWKGKIKAACIEQAAYGALYGQPTLAEVRTAAAIAVRASGCPLVMMISPATIRKQVFGNGNTRSQEQWPHLPPDAGSALGCALFAYIV